MEDFVARLIANAPRKRVLLKRRAGGDVEEREARSALLSVLHLGSRAVQALVVEVSTSPSALPGLAWERLPRRTDGPVIVLGYGLEANPLQGDLSRSSRTRVAVLTAVADRALRAAEDGAARDGRPLVPDEVIVGVPSSILQGRVYKVRRQRGEPTRPVSSREVQALWERAQRLASVPPQTGGDGSQPGDPLALLSLTSAGLFLDGRLTESPVGLQGATLGLAACALYVPASILRDLRLVAERLEMASIWLVAEPQAVAACLPGGTALGLDVGRWHTTAISVRGGALSGMVRFPWGGRDFGAGLARSFRCDLEDAEELQQAYSSGSLPVSSDRELVEMALQPLIEEWRQKLGKALGELALEGALPRQVYLYGGASYLPRLVEDGLGPLLLEQPLFPGLPEVGLLEHSMLSGVEDRTGLLFGREKVGALSLANWAAFVAGQMDNNRRLP